MMSSYHLHDLSPNQCGSCLFQTINAPISLVWSLIRRFDNPQIYNRFIKGCSILDGNGEVGSVREVKLVSGLSAETSRERLDELDDDSHLMIFSTVGGGDHRLINYRSTTTVHEIGNKTVVIESYVVDVPMGNSMEYTCLSADTIIRCNLRSLACIPEKMVSVH